MCIKLLIQHLIDNLDYYMGSMQCSKGIICKLYGDIMSNKKVGIMTLNTSNNYGAVLQAYALSHFLSRLGYEPFFVNYQEKRVGVFRYLRNPLASIQKLMSIESPAKALQVAKGKQTPEQKERKNLLLKEICNSFRSACLNVTNREYSHEMLVDECPEALAYICGSDAVWATDAYFKGPAYLLDFVPDKVKKISYAPSFGKGSLEPYQVEVFGKCLKRFDAVSVREQSGLEIIRAVAGVEAVRVLDPTFLVEDYGDIMDLSAVPKEPYVLVYRLSQKAALSSKTRNLIAELGRGLGIKVVNIAPDSDEGLDCMFEDILPTPGQFLGLIKSATYVLTNSFHGAVFSLLFEKNFICVPRDEAKDKKNLRMVELLELVGLGSLFCDKLADVDAVTGTLCDGYSVLEVKSKLDSSVEISRNFLINALRKKNGSF